MPTTLDYGIVVPSSGAEPADLYGVATRLGESVVAALADLSASDQKTLGTAANPTGTSNVNMDDLDMSVVVGSSDEVIWVDIDAVVGILTANATNEIELLVDGVANSKLLITRADNAILRYSGYKKWRLTGLSAGSHTLEFRTRSGGAAQNTSVLATATGASYWRGA